MVDTVVAAVGLVKPCGITSIQIQFFKCFPKHAIRSTIIKSDSDCTAFTFLYVFYFHICSIFKNIWGQIFLKLQFAYIKAPHQFLKDARYPQNEYNNPIMFHWNIRTYKAIHYNRPQFPLQTN